MPGGSQETGCLCGGHVALAETPLSPPHPQPSARSSPHSPWSAASSWASRRSSRNSLGRAPSLKRRSPSGERRSLLSGEGQESQDEEESSEEEREAKNSFDLPDTLQVPGPPRPASSRSSASEHQGCNGKSASGRLAQALHPDDPPLDGDDADDEGNLVRPLGAQCPLLPIPTLE